MGRTLLAIIFAFLSDLLFSQGNAVNQFLADSSMLHASVSAQIRDVDNGDIILDINSGKSLIPASVMKLITTGSALELLGPEYIFRTIIGYTGALDKKNGTLSGNIIILGGGDPALGSGYFTDHYGDLINGWVSAIKSVGIRRVSSKVLTDDSYYDYLPVPAKWQWEDMGNYYGAGVYGLTFADNIAEIHFKTGPEGSAAIITEVTPGESGINFENRLISAGTSDEGYVFSAPYGQSGWIEGTVPAEQDDFVLKGSITDPPLLIAKIVNEKLKAAGIVIVEEPSTIRLEKKTVNEEVITVSEIISPPLSEIIEVLNHESVNLFAEHLLKELGKSFKNTGSSAAGIDVVKDFLTRSGIKTDGIFIEDGSGLSTLNAINSGELVKFLTYMKNHGKYFPDYFKSLPEAGKNGTLRYCFTDPVFASKLNAKSGSMTRVRCYAGYLTTNGNRNMVFSILVNNYTGPSGKIISSIEDILKEIILKN
jgi:serine-type D-Ala-D-Ala carboxypeptidase/endopeptidase (penicillin-binding protein 4)